MHLLELTFDEVAFLTAPSFDLDSFQARLTRKLAATLTSRLRLPVQLMAQQATAPVEALATPLWLPGTALATLWLTRRLGGRRVTGTTSFIPPTLLHMLDATLAECWLDTATQPGLPSALAWGMTAAHTQATLAVQLPHLSIDMTRWARGVIKHG